MEHKSGDDAPADAAAPSRATINEGLDTMVAKVVLRTTRSLPVLRREIRELDKLIAECHQTRFRRREMMSAEAARDAVALVITGHECGATEATVRADADRYRVAATCSAHDMVVANRDIGVKFDGHEPEILELQDDTCDVCGPEFRMRRLATESLMACDTCGYSEPFMDTNLNAHGHDKLENQAFSYKRANHFIEWLNAVQGKEQTHIPDAVLDECCAQIVEERIGMDKVTAKVIRRVLKDVKRSRYYEHSPLIAFKLTGRPPLRFSATQEEALKAMFLSVQLPFEDVRARVAPERRNFLSYSYCMFKFCEIMGYDQFLPLFSLLKGRDKLFKQDVIFADICRILNWQFIPSV